MAKKALPTRRNDGLNVAYSTSIMLRFMNKDEMREFHKKYLNAFMKEVYTKEPTLTDIKVANDFRKGLLVSELAQKYKSTHGNYARVSAAINRVARQYYVKS